MKLAFAIASFFALALTLVRGGVISGRAVPDFNSSCTLPTSSTNITFQDFTIGFASATCDIAGCNAIKRSTIQERDICSTGNCAVTCTDLLPDPIVPDDCVPVIQYLESLGTETFTVAASTYDVWYLGTCGIAFWNYDCVDYTVCYGDFGINAETMGATCAGQTNGAVCAGAGTAGEMWAIAII